jgi:hypothetical protein
LVLKVPPIPVGPEGTSNTCWPCRYPQYLLVLKVPSVPVDPERTLLYFLIFLPNFHLLSPSSVPLPLLCSVGLSFPPLSVYVTLPPFAVTSSPPHVPINSASFIASSTTPCYSQLTEGQMSTTKGESFRCAASLFPYSSERSAVVPCFVIHDDAVSAALQQSLMQYAMSRFVSVHLIIVTHSLP